MNLKTKEEMVDAVVFGAQAIEAAIRKDPNQIQIGYQKVMRMSKSVEDLIKSRDLPEYDFVNFAVELKEGVSDQLDVVKDALEHLISGSYDPLEVAKSLSTCCATLNYIQTMHS